MRFPIKFVNKTGPFDFSSDFINLASNSAIVAAGSGSLAIISYVYLKTLFSNQIVRFITTAFFVGIASCGLIGVILGTSGLILIKISRLVIDILLNRS